MTSNGFLNIRKPAGLTSHHCVVKVRKLLKTRQVGHAGTLDPMATGVLTMALGNATKFLQYLATGKEYDGVIRFGVTTDSDDITGKVLSERPAPWLSQATIEATLQRFVGNIEQVPPRISAIRKNGVRMYELARANPTVEVAPRRVHISKIDVLELVPGPYPEARVHVECGTGTYIRSIARECGEALCIPSNDIDSSCQLRNGSGDFCVGGTLAALERTRNGAFTLADSVGFEELEQLVQIDRVPLQTIESALHHLPFIVLNERASRRWVRGGIVTITQSDVAVESSSNAPADDLVDGEAVRVYEGSASRKAFVGITRVKKELEFDHFTLRKRTFV